MTDDEVLGTYCCDPVTTDNVLRVAESIISRVRDNCEDLTGWGWDLAYGQAIRDGKLHLAHRIKMAKSLALYTGRDR